MTRVMSEEEIQVMSNPAKSPNSKGNKTERNRTPNAPLTSEEVDRLLGSINVMEDKVLLTFGFAAGVRVGEVASLDYSRLNEQEQCITVWDEKKDKERTIYIPL